MKTYVVSVSGDLSVYGLYRVRAESEEEALQKAQAELEEMAERMVALSATEEDYERWPEWELPESQGSFYFVHNITADEIYDVEEDEDSDS